MLCSSKAKEATHSVIVFEGAVCEGDVARLDVSAATLSKIRWVSKVPLYSMPIESGLEMERKAALTRCAQKHKHKSDHPRAAPRPTQYYRLEGKAALTS